MSAHTPGPWSVCGRFKNVVADQDEHPVCEAWLRDDSDLTHANVRLIAAAPVATMHFNVFWPMPAAFAWALLVMGVGWLFQPTYTETSK